MNWCNDRELLMAICIQFNQIYPGDYQNSENRSQRPIYLFFID